jgi:carboxyl-terminal processing protease
MLECEKKREIVKNVLLSLLLTPLLASELKHQDVKPIVEEMLSFHVDESFFNQKIAKRSFKNFIDKFDPNYKYLLSGEVQSILLRDSDYWSSIIENFQNSNLQAYQNLSKTILSSIQRAKKIRSEVREKILVKNVTKLDSLKPNYFSEDENELYIQWLDEAITEMKSYASENQKEELSREEKIKVLDFLERRYVSHEKNYLNSKNLPLYTLKAISSSLDAHSMYFSDDEALEMRQILRKEFCGVGIHLKERVDGPTISYIVPRSPAEASSLLHEGDIIEEINGQPTNKLSFKDVLSKLVGAPHTTVSLKVKSKAGKEEKVKLKREVFSLVEERLKVDYDHFSDGIIGYIQISSFYDNGNHYNVCDDLKNALEELKAKGELLGLILDVRGNFGGFLTQAVETAGIFSKKGSVVVAKYANDEIQFTRNKDSKPFYDGPLIILSSKASASAAEIVASTLQDEGSAIIVGDKRSYGKGSMQYQTVTNPKAKHFYKVTVGRYFTLSGKSPQLEGVKADIVVPSTYASMQLGEKYLSYPLKKEPMQYKKNIESELKKLFNEIRSEPSSHAKRFLPILKKNSEHRKTANENLRLFISQLEDQKIAQQLKMKGCGKDDLQKKEALEIMKDMILLLSLENRDKR